MARNKTKDDHPTTGGTTPARRAGVRVGVEIDGQVVRVVELDGNKAISYRTYTTGIADGLAEWRELYGRRVPDCTVVWAGTQSHLRRLPVPVVPSHALAAALGDAADEVLPLAPGSYVFAARVDPEIVSDGRYASLVAVPLDAVENLWEPLAQLRANLVPAEFMLRTDGLYLGVRSSIAELVMVAGGTPVAARQMPAGGIQALVAELSVPAAVPFGYAGEPSEPGEPRDGAARLDAVLRGASLDAADDAPAIVDRYVAQLLDEVRATVDFWERDGHAVPSQIYVHGVGAALPNLPSRLQDAAFQAEAAPLPFDIDLSGVSRSEHFACYGALLAAAVGPEATPTITIANPVQEFELAQAKASDLRRRLIYAGVGSMAVMVTLFLVPYVFARQTLNEARAERIQANEDLASRADATNLYTNIRAGSAAAAAAVIDEPDWPKVLAAALRTAPDGSQFASMGMIVGQCPEGTVNAAGEPVISCINIDVSAEVPGQGFSPAASWMRAIEAIEGAGVWPGGLRTSSNATVTNVSFTFSLPNDDPYRTARSSGVTAPKEG